MEEMTGKTLVVALVGADSGECRAGGSLKKHTSMTQKTREGVNSTTGSGNNLAMSDLQHLVYMLCLMRKKCANVSNYQSVMSSIC